MRRLLAGLVILSCAFISACSLAPARTGDLADRVNAALASGNEQDFLDLFVTEQQDEAKLLVENLALLGEIGFQVREDDVWRAKWRYPDEENYAYHGLRVHTFCVPFTCRISSISQLVGEPAPMWLSGRLSLTTKNGVSIVTAEPFSTIPQSNTGSPATGGEDWLAAAKQARQILASFEPQILLQVPNNLVIEAPGDESIFEHTLAATSFDYRSSPAVTLWTDFARGPDEETAAGRIIINPVYATALSAQQRDVLATHEAVHLATAHLGSPAPGRSWVDEGLAHHIGLLSSADEQQRVLARVSDYCATSKAAPADQDFASPVDPEPVYAWSAAAVGSMLALPDGPELLLSAWQGGILPDGFEEGICPGS